MRNGNGKSSDLFVIAARTIYEMTAAKSYKRGHILSPEDILEEVFYRATHKKVRRLRRCAWAVLKTLNQEYPNELWAIRYVGNDKRRGTAGWCIDNEKTAVITDNINANLQIVHEPRIQSFRNALGQGPETLRLKGK